MVKLYQMRDLCARFGVKFEMSVDTTGEMIIYRFGPKIAYAVAFDHDFTPGALYDVAIRLAANYQEKVIGHENRL
jgi:hypothetical protein